MMHYYKEPNSCWPWYVLPLSECELGATVPDWRFSRDSTLLIDIFTWLTLPVISVFIQKCHTIEKQIQQKHYVASWSSSKHGNYGPIGIFIVLHLVLPIDQRVIVVIAIVILVVGSRWLMLHCSIAVHPITPNKVLSLNCIFEKRKWEWKVAAKGEFLYCPY